MKKSKLFRMVYGLGIALIVSLIAALGGQNAIAQEIPNGDGDLLWERSIYPRFVNDAKFHPINGNIIAAVNHEIWEIDPKDGHTIRVFEGGTGTSEFNDINITTDGNTIVTDAGSGIDSVLVWDYNTGKITQILPFNAWYINIYPDNQRILIYMTKGQKYTTELGVYNIISGIFEKRINVDPIQQMVLSKDGKYIALGSLKETGGAESAKYMELWDAETLTKIRDFGEAGDIVEFRDIQISDDNQYVGFLCGGPRKMYLFNTDNSQLIKIYDYTSAFSFTPNTKIIIYSGTKPEDAQTNILSLPNLDTIYQYIWARSIFRFNESNEMYAGSGTMKLYSSRWYEVGIQNPIEIKNEIINIKYIEGALLIKIAGIDMVNSLIITDTLGLKIFAQDEITIIDNKIEIPLFLPSGHYLIRITSNGKEYFSKFIVLR